MKWQHILLTAALLSSSAIGQIQANLPTLIDAAQDRSITQTAGVILWPESVSANQTIVLCFNTQNDGTTFSLSDDGAAGTGAWTQTSVTSTPAPQTGTNVWMAYKQFSGTGRPTITLAKTSGSGFYYMMGMRFSGLGVVDGSVATATAGSPAGIGNISTSITTTVNGDMLVNCSGGAPFGSHLNTPNTTQAPNQQGTASPSISQLQTIYPTGALGTYTPTENMWGGSSTYAMQTLAFKPATTIFLSDTQMPDGGVGIAYSAQLHGFGGIAGYTYACTGLPANGLSLNTSTGVISGATPTAGTVSIGCTVTDGTNTSSTDNLSITIGTLATPVVRQKISTWSGDAGGSVTINGVQCGSILLFIRRGDDTHSGQGWVQAVSGANNKVLVSPSMPVRRIMPIAGNNAWPLEADLIGPVTQTGSFTVSVPNNQSASSGRPINMILEVSGANNFDSGAHANSLNNTASGSFAVSYITLVPNVLLVSASDTTAAVSLSLSAPFSSITTGLDVQGVTLYGTAAISAASTVTATTSFSGASTSNQAFDGLVIPLRPSIAPTACPANTFAGEKIRRQIF